MLDTCCRMYVRVLVLINISKRQCSPTRNIKNRVKQLRLEHVHKFYNKSPTYLKDNFRKVEDYGCKTISRQLNRSNRFYLLNYNRSNRFYLLNSNISNRFSLLNYNRSNRFYLLNYNRSNLLIFFFTLDYIKDCSYCK
jgi:hypothetical protein